MNFDELNIGLDGHVCDDSELSQYMEYIKDSIHQGAYQTASLYAENLTKRLFTRYEFESMKENAK